MRYLITGAKGQLATEFIKHFQQQSVEYFAFSKEELDITNFDTVYKTLKEIKPDVVINCAAYNLVDNAEKEPEKAYSINAVGPYNLALASKEIKAKFIHYSTDYVFDGTKEGLYTEEDTPNPLNEYGKSKLLGENLAKINENSLIFRVSWIYGEGKQNFLYKLLSWAKDNEVLKVAINEFSVPTSTSFIVDKTLKAINKELRGLYHLVPNGYASRYEWAKLILKNYGIKKIIIPVSKETFNLVAKRPSFSVLDSDKIQKGLNEVFEEWDEIFIRWCRTQ
ncbi:dTDP-4-dehydrorhamnose reductase [Thermodesulfovibrio sp. 3462-1]|uniref:dTDP-4-dehydrorhamnose reductase n=1 Tax=Thermodesulfovibrio obliviosus TaxID=3118332 RepID=A0AAU8H2K7_9BACT